MRMTNKHSTAVLDAMVELVRAKRPHWQTPGIRASIRTVLGWEHPPTHADLAYALVRIADDPSIATPHVLTLEGPHWRRTPAQASYAPRGRCPDCGGLHDPADEHTPPESDRTNHTDQLRSVLAAVRESLCSHGVPRHNCLQHEEPA